jgi:hypothetical protein
MMPDDRMKTEANIIFKITPIKREKSSYKRLEGKNKEFQVQYARDNNSEIWKTLK